MLRNRTSLGMKSIMTIRNCYQSAQGGALGRKFPVSGWLERPGHHKLAYKALPGTTAPGVLFCPGFQSTMEGAKALALEAFCQERGCAFTRFDYQGCGKSGGDIRDVTFSDWRDDVLAVLDKLTRGRQILVGSSMGSWLALLAASERPDRIHAFIGVASAPDFNQRSIESFPAEMRKELEETGETRLPSEYGEYVLTKRFLANLPRHFVLGAGTLQVTCPVRLLHGIRDRSVPYGLTLKLAEKIASTDIRILLTKHGDHQLSKPQDLQVLLTELESLMKEEKHTPPTPALQSAL